MPVFRLLRKLQDIQVSASWLKQKPGSTRVRVTGAGWGFSGLILCGFLLSINFSNNLIFAMTFLLVSIAMVGWYHTRLNVSGLLTGDWQTEPVFAGQKVLYRMKVDNRRPYGRHGLHPGAPNTLDAPEKHLPGGAQGELVLKRQAGKRGLLPPVSRARISSSFPLGIFEARLRTEPLPECLVYPQPLGREPLPDQVSGSQAHLLSESGTYTDMRRYSPGDPLSRVSWKAYARFDQLYTKEFDGAQGQPALWLRWDDVRADGLEQKLSQLCRWVVDANGANREYGLELPGLMIEPGSEESHLHRCLRELALFKLQETAA